MTKCIMCNKETNHSICEECVEGLLNGMSRKDIIAHALVGMDVMEGRGNLLEKLKEYKELLKRVDI